MHIPLPTEEKDWIALLKRGDERAMEYIFHSHYQYLVSAAFHFLKDDHLAKDLVQDVLFNFWVKRENLQINASLKSYLRRSVVNKAIDKIRQKKIWGTTEEISELNQPVFEEPTEKYQEEKDLHEVILSAIESLPEKCKVVFSLSRLEDLSHKEIAERLDISPKTIENQITKALKTIRAAVNQYKELGTLFLYWIL